jgi:hypothetical protein
MAMARCLITSTNCAELLRAMSVDLGSKTRRGSRPLEAALRETHFGRFSLLKRIHDVLYCVAKE